MKRCAVKIDVAASTYDWVMTLEYDALTNTCTKNPGRMMAPKDIPLVCNYNCYSGLIGSFRIRLAKEWELDDEDVRQDSSQSNPIEGPTVPRNGTQNNVVFGVTISLPKDHKFDSKHSTGLDLSKLPPGTCVKKWRFEGNYENQAIEINLWEASLHGGIFRFGFIQDPSPTSGVGTSDVIEITKLRFQSENSSIGVCTIVADGIERDFIITRGT